MKIFILALMGFAGLAYGQTILVFGDSLSAAYNINEQDGWVQLMAERLGPDYHVINASISGETARGGLARLPSALSRSQADIVILELGANDGLRAQPIAQIKNHLQQMIELSLAAQAEVLLLGIQLPPNYGSAYTLPFRDLYFELAQEQPISFVPFMLEGIAQFPELMQADGLHPRAAAQSQILELVWPQLLPLLQLAPDRDATQPLN